MPHHLPGLPGKRCVAGRATKSAVKKAKLHVSAACHSWPCILLPLDTRKQVAQCSTFCRASRLILCKSCCHLYHLALLDICSAPLAAHLHHIVSSPGALLHVHGSTYVIACFSYLLDPDRSLASYQPELVDTSATPLNETQTAWPTLGGMQEAHRKRRGSSAPTTPNSSQVRPPC